MITAGELFGRSGYGVGLQKGSPWADKITLAILDYHESKQHKDCFIDAARQSYLLLYSFLGGLMEDLDNKWILNASSSSQDCREKDGNNPVTLGLENMRGVRIYIKSMLFISFEFYFGTRKFKLVTEWIYFWHCYASKIS